MAKLERFLFHSVFPYSVEKVYDWHARPGALERLIPPWEKTSVLHRRGGLEPGGEVEMRMHVGPFPYRWIARHVENSPGSMFRDEQHKGPFKKWSHTHIFKKAGRGTCLVDKIDYALPLHNWSAFLVKKYVRATLQRTFEHRRRVLCGDLELHAQYEQKPLKVLISGASGVLGTALQPLLTTGGHEVWTLVRRKPNKAKREIYWNPQAAEIDELPPVDAVIHLAGEYIGLGRWTAEKKKRVMESRTKGTALLAREIANRPSPPEVFLSASAVGYYGDTEAVLMEEDAAGGQDYISEVCKNWEEAARPAELAGIRTVLMRIGVSLSPGGGALQRLLSNSFLGLSGGFGGGNQYISWISLDDTISAIYHAMRCPTLSGPLNICSPQPLTNIAFMRTLSRVCGRPQPFSVPSALLTAFYGQMATEILLSGCRASCRKLLDSGFVFRHPTLEEALRCMLGKVPLAR